MRVHTNARVIFDNYPFVFVKKEKQNEKTKRNKKWVFMGFHGFSWVFMGFSWVFIGKIIFVWFWIILIMVVPMDPWFHGMEHYLLVWVSAVKTLYIGIQACSMDRSMMFRMWTIQFHPFLYWPRYFWWKFLDWSIPPWGWKMVKSYI